jgi:hypothetical protein
LRLISDRDFRRTAMTIVANARYEISGCRNTRAIRHGFVEAIAPIRNRVGACLANALLNRIPTQSWSEFNGRRGGASRNLMLVTCRYFPLIKALIPDFESPRIDDAKFDGNILQSSSLR